jgi:hypothetical protein
MVSIILHRTVMAVGIDGLAARTCACSSWFTTTTLCTTSEPSIPNIPATQTPACGAAFSDVNIYLGPDIPVSVSYAIIHTIIGTPTPTWTLINISPASQNLCKNASTMDH